MVAPSDILGVSLVEDKDLVGSDDDVFIVKRDFEGEFTMSRVILELVRHVLRLEKGIIDGHHLEVWVFERGAEHQAPNAAEAIDSHVCLRHFLLPRRHRLGWVREQVWLKKKV